MKIKCTSLWISSSD